LLHISALLARDQYAENQVIPSSYRAAFLFPRYRALFGMKLKIKHSQ
jgi:hypothetical protein